MEYSEVINGRRSTRGFLEKPVTMEVLKEVIELAVRAPSSMNTQPWHFHIVTGEVLDNIRRENTKRNVEGVPPSREIKSPLGYEGKHRERQIEIAIQLFQEMGIERDDKEKDAFVHASAVKAAGMRFLNEGDKIEFTLEDGPKGPSAVNLKKLD